MLRPKYHFTPEKGWINDPNGPVFYKGKYHLFYQHDPNSLVWDRMHWGHAISDDLLAWKHLPIVLFPDETGDIYSGSAVVDKEQSGGISNGSDHQKRHVPSAWCPRPAKPDRAGRKGDISL